MGKAADRDWTAASNPLAGVVRLEQAAGGGEKKQRERFGGFATCAGAENRSSDRSIDEVLTGDGTESS